jgi:hypothetical protein
MKTRTLVCSERYQRNLEVFRPHYPRLDDVVAGLEFVIARNPGGCSGLWWTDVRYARSDSFPGMPVVVILFSGEDADEECRLHDLWIG